MSYEKTKQESYTNLGGINNKVSPYVNNIAEFRDLTNLNFNSPGSLSKRIGTTLYTGASVLGRITGGVEFERLSGASYLVVTANTNAYTVTTGAFSAFRASLLNNALFDFTVYVDRLFGCNGQDFFKFDGSQSSNFSLPSGLTGSWGVTGVAGGSLSAGVTATFVFAYGYLNDRGYLGPVSNGITITISGAAGQNSVAYYGLTTPTGYGVTAIALYRTSVGGVDQFGTTFAPVGTTTVTDIGFPLTTTLESTALWFTLAPRYVELFNNQLFMAGFSSMLSTAWWSDIGEPESVQPEYFAEFRTNDGDRITGMKFYNSQLIVSKERSMHRITGDNPDNFLITEITDQYGCLSNRALVVWEDILWFLDPKGIIHYDGANINIVSNKVESVFQSMNVEAAKDNAVGLHVKDLNEVWFAIPCNGATLNNTILVHDYFSKCWTKYEGLDISSLWLAKQGRAKRVPFFGGYTGNIFDFGASYMGDNGNAITCMAKTSFVAQSGHTTERLWRRFYMDVDPILGVTSAISVNLFSNFGTTVQAARTMYQNPFQSRIDFGISSKSIQAQIIHSSATLPFKMNGYTFESRFQRAV